MPNQEQWMALLRAVLVIVGTYLTSKGITTDANWQMLVGAAITLTPIVWGMITNTKAAMVKKAAALDEVNKVEMKPTKDGIELAHKAGSSPDAIVTVGK